MRVPCLCPDSRMSAQRLEVSLLGVGTVLRLRRDEWSMVNLLRHARNDCPPGNVRGSHTSSKNNVPVKTSGSVYHAAC